MQNDDATCPECRSPPGPSEVYKYEQGEGDNKEDGENEDENDEDEQATGYSENPLAQLISENFEAANDWIDSLPSSRRFSSKYVDPTFKPKFDALLATCDIESRVKFKGLMVTPLAFAAYASIWSKDCADAAASLIASGARIESLGIFMNFNSWERQCEPGDETLENALFGACLTVQPECVKALLAIGVNPNIKNASGSTPLMKCLDSDIEVTWSLDVVNLLIASGATVSTRNFMSENVFQVMVRRENINVSSNEGAESSALIDVLMAAFLKENT
jgi:hypothetical protein